MKAMRAPIPAGRRAPRCPWTAGALVLVLLMAGLAPVPALAADGPVADAAVSAGKLSGVTLDALGRVLPRVRILARPVGGGEDGADLRTAFSDERGRFSLEQLAPGAYDIVALKGGYAVLAARVNTALERTLELILRPSGTAGPEGSKPEDGSWALRLPERDSLESRDAAIADGSSTPRSHLLLAAGQVAWSEGGADEFYADYAQEFDLGGGGTLSAFLEHRSRSSRDDEWERDDLDAAHAMWSPPADASSLWPRLDIGGVRRTRGVPVNVDAFRHAMEEAERAYVRSAWSSSAGSDVRRVVTLDLAGLWVREGTETGSGAQRVEEASSASRLEVTAVEERTWSGLGGAHRTRIRARGSAAQGVIRNQHKTPTLALGLEPDAPVLEAVGRENLDVSVTDRMVRTAHVELVARARGGYVDGLEDPAAAAASVGARLRAVQGLLVDLEAGLASAGAGDSETVWTIGLSGGDERWSWRVARRAGASYAPWEDAAVGGSSGGTGSARMLAGREAEVDRWTASIAWEGTAGWPKFELRGEIYRTVGALAVHVPDDVARVPFATEGAAEGREWGLLMELPRTGTWVELELASVEDQSAEPQLFDGTALWRRQTVHVRQRLGELSWAGATWHLAFAFERSDLEEASGQEPETPRIAMLSRSRFLGGVSLAF
jgi:hypothetical protein